jgi:hypothetical protein
MPLGGACWIAENGSTASSLSRSDLPDGWKSSWNAARSRGISVPLNGAIPYPNRPYSASSEAHR